DAPRNYGVCAHVTRRGIGDVHRSALAPAVAGFFAQKLRKHPVWRRPLGQAMTVPTVRAGDVVVRAQRFANTYGHRFLANVKMGQAGHQGPGVQIVHALLEQPDRQHLPVETQVLIHTRCNYVRTLGGDGHFSTPDIRARTSKTTAKSFFSQPIPRAAVRNSLLTAVVGTGTFSCRPSSIASSMSFCIMLQSNQASSGCCRMKGPRY